MRCSIYALGSMFLLSHALAEPFQIEHSRNQILASVEDVSQAAQGKIESVKNKAGKKIKEVKQEVGEKFQEVKQEAGEKVQKVKQEAGEKFQEVKQEAGDAKGLASSAQEKASDEWEGVSHAYNEVLSSVKETFSDLFRTKDTE